MTGLWVACLLLTVALAVVWPSGGAALVRRRLLPRRPAPDQTPRWPALVAAARRQPRRLVLGAVGMAVGAALLAGGPVAGAVTAAYGALAGRAFLRRAVLRRTAADRAAALDDLVALAADLRAGLPPLAAGLRAGLPPLAAGLRAGAPTSPRHGPPPVDRLARLTASVWRLAERTGAPAADLVERIEADARAADRAAVTATAQAAGARATALLLAALPAGGIGIGVAIGADPVGVLLHTPLGAACALGAVLLQCCGLWWADRLAAGAAR